MSDLAITAQRLRYVREATRNFLTLWALDQMRDRVRDGGEAIEQIDTQVIEDAIRDLDVYNSPLLLRGVLAED